MGDRPFDICVVGLKCYDLLVGSPVPKYLGGIERILVAFARTMASKGINVAFITYDEGQSDIEVINGITIVKAHDADAGLPIVRLLHPRMTAVWRAMKAVNAPVYIQMGAGVETMATALGVRIVGHARSKFVYCTASNMDCEQELTGIDSFHERIIYRLALRMVDKVVCQTQVQAEMMKKNYRLECSIIPMPFEAPSTGTQEALQLRNPTEAFDLLWVGRTVEVKRIEWFLDLAERIPEATFHIVGSANQASEYAAAQMQRAKSLKNVIVHGRISDEQLQALYQNAYALCCTSVIEGFPTTFLEAWKIGLPIFTTFDPDQLVEKTGAGFSVDNLDAFESSMMKLRNDAELYRSISRRSIALYREQFSPASIVGKYLKLFNLQPSTH